MELVLAQLVLHLLLGLMAQAVVLQDLRCDQLRLLLGLLLARVVGDRLELTDAIVH